MRIAEDEAYLARLPSDVSDRAKRMPSRAKRPDWLFPPSPGENRLDGGSGPVYQTGWPTE
jgi:hypothetical protein